MKGLKNTLIDQAYAPEFIVEYSYPYRLVGIVDMFSDEWRSNLMGYVDTSRVKYEIRDLREVKEDEVTFFSWDLDIVIDKFEEITR